VELTHSHVEADDAMHPLLNWAKTDASSVEIPKEAIDSRSLLMSEEHAMRNVVNALFVRDETILLVRRSPHRRIYPNLWSFPGGHVEDGETLDEALIRECREEVGIIPVGYMSLGSITDPNFGIADPVTYHMYTVTVWEEGEPTMIGDEHTELCWFALETAASLPDLALTEYRQLFLKISVA
jgi:8-oxo-dGTP diphosphatase